LHFYFFLNLLFSLFDLTELCKEHGQERCYNWRVDDEHSVRQCQQDLENKLEKCFHDFSSSQFAICCCYEPVQNYIQSQLVNCFEDKINIDFDPSCDENTNRFFFKFGEF
jgi:hypothetical protein